MIVFIFVKTFVHFAYLDMCHHGYMIFHVHLGTIVRPLIFRDNFTKILGDVYPYKRTDTEFLVR